MDDRQVTDSLKKILMAGFGAVTTGVEKSQQALDKFAEKGEDAYQQAVAAGRETAEKLKKAYEESGIRELFREGLSFGREDLLTAAANLSVEDILWLQNQLAALAVRKAAAQPAAEETPEPEEAACAPEEDGCPDDEGNG